MFQLILSPFNRGKPCTMRCVSRLTWITESSRSRM